ncbi:MAG: 2Fe-2S iron-sulfur cluster-binding protein, partial [Ornithinimicrobium sp.]
MTLQIDQPVGPIGQPFGTPGSAPGGAPYAPEIDFGTPAVSGPADATVTVDGVEVQVPAGTSVMRAAKQAGI